MVATPLVTIAVWAVAGRVARGRNHHRHQALAHLHGPRRRNRPEPRPQTDAAAPMSSSTAITGRTADLALAAADGASRRAVLARRGVCYDVGRDFGGPSTRPELNMRIVGRELQIIRDDLHCNLVRADRLPSALAADFQRAVHGAAERLPGPRQRSRQTRLPRPRHLRRRRIRAG
jgi:hypothetical protein